MLKKILYLAIFAGLTAVGCKDYDCMPGVIKVNMTDQTIVLTNVNDFNEFDISCPMSWAVTGTVPSWLGVDPPKGGAGITPTTITIKEAHTGDTPRTAILRFMAANGDKVAVTVTQNPSDPTPPAPVGEIIVYDGSNHEVLKPDPGVWWGDNCLFPSLTSLAYNQVSLTGGVINFVYGGLTTAEGATVAHNTATMSDGEADGVYGGYSETGAVTGNSAHMSGGMLWFEVTGGRSETGAVTGNSAHVSDGPALGVVGGDSYSGDVIGNRAILSGGNVADVFGGRGSGGNVTGNHAIVSGGSVYNVYGGRSNFGAATGNHVVISGGSVEREVFGGRSYEDATGNTV
ncbi:MAG: hypothetical protein FWE99_02000, partial [Bacteroidales bacterium]|nr:hypothetical protein [Bacteroidales bacterium]